MRLATMMNLVLKQVQQQSIGAFGLHAVFPMHADSLIGAVLVKRAAPGNQPAINRSLLCDATQTTSGMAQD